MTAKETEVGKWKAREWPKENSGSNINKDKIEWKSLQETFVGRQVVLEQVSFADNS